MGAMKRTPVRDLPPIDRRAVCPTCGNESNDLIFQKGIVFIGAAVESPEYNPALGQVVKNSKHRAEIAKRRGLVEIGNESPDKIHKKHERERAEKRKKSWESV